MQHQRVAVHVLADPAASSWLGLTSPEEGARGFTLQLDTFDPIDTQLYKCHLSNMSESQREAENRARNGNPPLPPPATLGLIMFRNDVSSAQFLLKKNLRAPLPKPRSLGLESMLLFSETLLPGVDHTAATSSSTSDLIAFLNASGMEASPFQLIHGGVNVMELATVAGQAVSNGSFSSNPISGDSFGLKQDDGGSNSPSSTVAAATVSALPSVPPGRLCLLVVGDILSYCSKDILQMVAQMARPFRALPPTVIQQQLLAYCAQDACLVGGKVLVARDGCAVWRPQGESMSQGRRRAGSLRHSSQNSDVEKFIPTPQWDGGAAVFVNHPIGPAWFDRIRQTGNNFSDGSFLANPVFRRVLRITWADAFLGAEHGGPEARRRFSAPTVAVGIIHSSQVHQATKVSESGVLTGGHVFGNVKESVMWCMSPDAALFPGPYLHPVRGTPLQCSPHIYLTPPKAFPPPQQSATTSSSNNNNKDTENINNVNNSKNSSSSKSASAPEVNPTVLSTTVTIFCDIDMNCMTIMNNNRRVVSWDLSEIWAVKKGKNKNSRGDGESESEQTATVDGDDQSQQSEGNNNNNNDEGDDSKSSSKNKKMFASVFYPVVDLGFPGTIVEVIA